MNDAEYEAQKARIEAVVEPWRECLGLKWWHRLDISFERDRSVFERPTTSADARADWEYKIAEVRFNLPQIAEESDAELEDTVVHEFVHVLLASYDLLIQKGHEDSPLVEHTVTSLTQAIFWVRDAAKAGNL